jgi:hypothetical protein
LQETASKVAEQVFFSSPTSPLLLIGGSLERIFSRSIRINRKWNFEIGSLECDGRTMQKCNTGRIQQNLGTLLSFTSIFSHGVPHYWFFSMATGSCDGIFIKAKDCAGEK